MPSASSPRHGIGAFLLIFCWPDAFPLLLPPTLCLHSFHDGFLQKKNHFSLKQRNFPGVAGTHPQGFCGYGSGVCELAWEEVESPSSLGNVDSTACWYP